MPSSIRFYAGSARAIAKAVRDGEDPRKLKNTLGCVDLSFHLPPITSIDQLVEALNRVTGAELESFETALEDGALLEDESGASAEVVDSEWVRSVAGLKNVSLDAVFEGWIAIMSEEEGVKIAPSPKLKPALDEFFTLMRKASAQKAAVVHVWTM